MLQRKRAKESRDDMDGDNTEKQESTLSMDAVRCSTEEDDSISYNHSVSFQMETAVQREARHASMRHYEARQPTSETVLAEQHKVRLAAAWLAHSQANGHALHRSSTSGFGLTML